MVPKELRAQRTTLYSLVLGKFGCVCNVTSESNCRVIVELAIPCSKPGPRVNNGMTQYGYDKAYKEYSFDTDQRRVSLYMTVVSSLSKLVQKPTVTVFPETGLEVTLSGSAATGSAPTTSLNIDWRCTKLSIAIF
ncbi:hypothetical protein QVD17_37830 [Tagetes erecta]|uniref:Uncharacterized protein n=1 Tax=Tagetes erecta TaxID=13708 RepID=A0AAD8JWQ9_TARER|nr:hypothetical protein QVD17_37830 [Tagetes erecta]